MELVEIISKKIQRMAQEHGALKRENQQLQSEVDLLRDEMKKQRPISLEHGKQQKEREQIKFRLEKVNKKLEKLLTNLAPTPIFSTGEPDEKYN